MLLRIVGAMLVGMGMAGAADAAISIDYALYSLGGYTDKGGSTIAGGVAVAGDAQINSTAIGTRLDADSKGMPVVAVGGTVQFDNSALAHGDVVYGKGDASGEYTRAATPGGSFRQGDPLDFARVSEYLLGLSARHGDMVATGRFDSQWGAGTLTASGKGGTDVFVLSIKELGSLHALRLVGAEGSKAIINIFGDTFDSHFKFDRGNYAVADVTFNFVDAKSIGLNGLELAGSILAPLATISQQGGRIDGTIVAGHYRAAGANIGGDGRLMLEAGETEAGAVPEPGTWVMLIIGFGLVGTMMRRRGPRAAAA